MATIRSPYRRFVEGERVRLIGEFRSAKGRFASSWAARARSRSRLVPFRQVTDHCLCLLPDDLLVLRSRLARLEVRLPGVGEPGARVATSLWWWTVGDILQVVEADQPLRSAWAEIRETHVSADGTSRLSLSFVSLFGSRLWPVGDVIHRRDEQRLERRESTAVVALGRLCWPLRRIEAATGVRRETASGDLKAAGVRVAGRGRRGLKPAIPAGVSTDSGRVEATPGGMPAGLAYVDVETHAGSERERVRGVPRGIVQALGRGRNAMAIWQDLVDDHGFTAGYASVKRFVSKLRSSETPEARVVITMAPGEEYVQRGVMLSRTVFGSGEAPLRGRLPPKVFT